MPIANELHFIDPTTIVIEREDRQRAELEVDDLLPSISAHGVLNPIIINRAGVLVAGERRLTATLQLGLPTIPVRYLDELGRLELRTIELEENVRRQALDWKDHTRALVEIQALLVEERGKCSQEDLAKHLGVSQVQVQRFATVARFLADPLVAEQTTLQSAYNVAKRKLGRQTQDALSDIMGASREALSASWAPPATPAPQGQGQAGAAGPSTAPAATPALPAAAWPIASQPAPAGSRPVDTTDDTILLADFLEWAPQYHGPKFNFLHCDFPYGVKLFEGNKLKGYSEYAETADLYFALIQCLCDYREQLLTANAHVMFWFSMEHYIKTRTMFAKLAPDIHFQNFPLVWVKSDNAGLLPDGNRAPRRIYETALMGVRGDRFVAKAISNAYSAPTNREYHPSTKPVPVLKHFFQLFVDDGTRMLDPTCGGGSALRAAEAMGAESVLGLEVSPEYHSNACSALQKQRRMENASKAIIAQAKQGG